MDKSMYAMANGCKIYYEEIIKSISWDEIIHCERFKGVSGAGKLGVKDLYKETMLSMLYVAKDRIQKEIDDLGGNNE